MMRSGAPLLPPYLPVVDEVNKFNLEGTPSIFSMRSGLSAITIESNLNTAPVEASAAAQQAYNR